MPWHVHDDGRARAEAVLEVPGGRVDADPAVVLAHVRGREVDPPAGGGAPDRARSGSRRGTAAGTRWPSTVGPRWGRSPPPGRCCSPRCRWPARSPRPTLGGRSAADVADDARPKVAVATSIHTTRRAVGGQAPTGADRGSNAMTDACDLPLVSVLPIPRAGAPTRTEGVAVLLGRGEDGHGDLVGHRLRYAVVAACRWPARRARSRPPGSSCADPRPGRPPRPRRAPGARTAAGRSRTPPSGCRAWRPRRPRPTRRRRSSSAGRTDGGRSGGDRRRCSA